MDANIGRQGMRVGNAWLVLAGVSAVACQKPESAAPTGPCVSCTWQLLGIHTQASAQPPATGKALVTLCPWRGKLYVGYGDYETNTGPVDVTAWDPARSEFTRMHISDTEAIYNYRPIGDALYAPATDRRDHADYAVGEPWRDENPVTVAHAYDMATFDGGDLWLVGSVEGGHYPATAWRSTDGGAHWTVAHQTAQTARYYFAALFRHRLYVEAWWNVPEGPSEAFDGTGWSPGPELLPGGGHGYRPVVFADRLVYASKQTFTYASATIAAIRHQLVATPNRLLAFDGTAVTAILDRELLDFFADDRQLLALDTDGTIWCTTDLTRWSRLTTAAELHPRSLAVLDGSVYLGTTDSRLYRLVGWTSG